MHWKVNGSQSAQEVLREEWLTSRGQGLQALEVLLRDGASGLYGTVWFTNEYRPLASNIPLKLKYCKEVLVFPSTMNVNGQAPHIRILRTPRTLGS